MLSVRLRKQLREFELDVAFALECERCVALIGPTGCGKSMTLRCMAGLERPDAGRIVCSARVLYDSGGRVDLSPDARRVGFVFQDYALFPHMTVLENVMYGPRVRGRSKADIQAAAKAALGQVRMLPQAAERPEKLSGGQCQRVALARAIASKPDVLLLDEPMSALDTQTRRRVRFELRSLIERIEIPTVVVTHEPEDALTLGDLICVLDDGRIIQTGDRRELVERPRSDFLAEFMGLNLLRGTARPSEDGFSTVSCGGRDFVARGTVSGPACLTVRATDIRLGREAPEGLANCGTFRVTGLSHTGQAVRVTVENSIIIQAELAVERADELNLAPGETVVAGFAPEAALCYEEADV